MHLIEIASSIPMKLSWSLLIRWLPAWDVLFAVADGKSVDVVPTMHRLYSQGTSPALICSSAYRYFRSLHAVSLDQGNLEQAFYRLRPPVFGPRRNRMARQVRRLGTSRLEAPLKELFSAELNLRSPDPPPLAATVERTLLRVSWVVK